MSAAGAAAEHSMQYAQLSLASHGTPGARAAESLAFACCAPGATLHHLFVVPELWNGMMGDDWLNNVRTRIRFGRYLEDQLEGEIDDNLRRLAQRAAELGVNYLPEVRQGEPTECLIAWRAEHPGEVLVIGSPRPKGEEGLRSRLRLDTLLRALTVPLLVAPHPNG